MSPLFNSQSGSISPNWAIVEEPTTAAFLRKYGSRVGALLQAARLHNAIALAAVGFAGVYAADPTIAAASALVYFLFWTLLGTGIYLINDACDVDADLVNKPWKPLPNGRISFRVVLSFGVVATAFGAVGAALSAQWLLSSPAWIAWTATCTAAGLGVLYSTWIKKNCSVAANLIISGNVAIVALVPFTALGRWDDVFFAGVPVYVFGLLAREYLKDAEDAAADQIAGRRTFAVVYGARRVATVSRTILILTLTWCVAMLASGAEPWEISKYLAFLLCGGVALRLLYGETSSDVAKAQRWLKPALLFFLLFDLLRWV